MIRTNMNGSSSQFLLLVDWLVFTVLNGQSIIETKKCDILLQLFHKSEQELTEVWYELEV